MNTLKHLPAIAFGCALALLVSGCATPYRPQNNYGGYSDVQITNDAFRVGFVANNCTSVSRAHDMAMLRAAELTKAHNFAYFVVIEDNHISVTNRTITPAQIRTRIYHSGPGYGSDVEYTPPQVNESTRPIIDILIHCFSEKPEDLTSYDAGSLQQFLREKYKIKPQTPQPLPASAP